MRELPLLQAIRDRQHLHQNPELSFQEIETSRYIQRRLEDLGIEYHLIANTGVVGLIEGEKSSSNSIVVLRADMDALPIEEKNDLFYKSNNLGIMHACGHDFHMANLLAVATVLNDLKKQISGRVLLLFQPAEEKIPGGAIQVLESGVLESFGGIIKAVIGIHVSPKYPTGTVGLCAGRFMASSDEIYINIRGKSGHAAEPHLSIDPIMIAVDLLTTLQQIVSRKANPNTPSVLTFGRFEGNGAANVIPNEVHLAGTFRTMDETWRAVALTYIQTIVNSHPALLGATAELEIRHGYPTLYNDPQLTQRAKTLWQEKLGTDKVADADVWMAAEDFAYYSQRYPSLFALIGINNGSEETQYGLHSERFNLDENAFSTSISTLVDLTLDLLNE